VLTTGSLCGAIVNAAGDIATFGGPRPDEHFRVGIVDPMDRTRMVRVVEVRGALATSGESERGHHLLEPFTHTWQAAVASASVVGPDLGTADALATALAVGGSDVLSIIHGLDDYEGFVVDYDGGHRATPGFPFAENA
jgi:thiamine biosynthesis lipoprotein